MNIKKQRTVNGLENIQYLVQVAGPTIREDWNIERIKKIDQLTVIVIATDHANCDSLPLRFGIHFKTDSTITLHRVEVLYQDTKYLDRFHVEVWYMDHNENEQSGHFILGVRRGFDDLVLVTVWRHDSNTESRLSEVMSALRIQKFLTPEILLDLHPFYREKLICTSADLVKYLTKYFTEKQILSMQSVVDVALINANTAITERDKAIAEKQIVETAANENASLAKILESERNILQSENLNLQATNEALKEEIEAERARFILEQSRAKFDGKVATLSDPTTLIDVLENKNHFGSICTVLIMGDQSRRYMKTITFDPDRSITAKALKLKGRRVRISCWDSSARPDYYANLGYFRNVYAAE